MTALVILLRLFATILAVVQQPVFLPTYVSPYNVTQFNPVREYGSIGLLAHDYTTAGRILGDISEGNFIAVTFSDGETAQYVVSDIVHAQALEWANPYGDLMLDGEQLTSTQLILRVFRPNYLTLQTCEGRAGRLFVIAQRIEKEPDAEREE